MDSTEPARVIMNPGESTEQSFVVGERMTIGRSPSNSLILDDQSASRHHAELRHVGGGRYRITDVGSANGTWVNGRRLTVPRELEDGDQVLVGKVRLRFAAPATRETSEGSLTGGSGTAVSLRGETVVVLVSDIRNYTGMSEVLPNREFSNLISDWFREITATVERNAGTVDKFIGDAVLAYWVAVDAASPQKEIHAALRATREMIEQAEVFSARLSSEFSGHTFRIGVGLNVGEVMMGNVGTGEVQSFTIVGDPVNIAFRLESLTKQHGVPVIVSSAIAEHMPRGMTLQDLGKTEIHGRKEPVSICALSWR